MKKKILLIVLILIFSSANVFAAIPRSPVYRDPDNNRQTWFNKMSDSMATIGKSEKEKKDIKRERRLLRRQKRIDNAEARRNAKSHRQIKNQQKIIMKKVNDLNEARRLK